MIYGRVLLGAGRQASLDLLQPLRSARPSPGPGRPPLAEAPQEAVAGRAAFGHLPDGCPTLDRHAGAFTDGKGAAVAQGWPGNTDDLRRQIAARGLPLAARPGLAELVLAAVRAFGEEAPSRLPGTVAFAAADAGRDLVVFSRDRLGVEPLFWGERPGEIVFASRARGVADTGSGRALDGEALREFLLLGYLVGERTLFAGVLRLLGGRAVAISGDGAPRRMAWWDPAPGVCPPSRDAAIDTLRVLMRDAVRVRMEHSGGMGVLLSGGLDSSAVTALLCDAAGKERIQAFSFRCRGESYDESAFAARVADACGCRRHLVEYTPERVAEMGRIAAEMDEPFCDIGINIATWILADEAARQGVPLVLTGDGGDELFCGHPVYPADRLARRLEGPGGGLVRLLARHFTSLADSPAKKNLRVKLKRFSMGLIHPSDLGPSRWRFHSLPAEVDLLLAPSAPRGTESDPYSGVRAALAGAQAGVDVDARRVLADYRIVVEFYLRRLILARRFGIEARLPWLDHRLIELAAALPSAWRTTGLKDEKVLMKRVVEPWLPHEVVYRKDKLGHSVPFKNWLRDSPPVREIVEDALGKRGLARRGLVDPDRVSRLREAHASGRENTSHRLWALTVLELWLRGNFP